jgi:glycosyltransferase involved in cell wall biosynthesis
MLNLFYEEPDNDRWLPFDRFPRALLRRLIRGKPRVGGQMRVFLNLKAGLDRIGIAYRVNHYKHIRKHQDEIACIVGKPHVLDKIEWKNPIVFGAAVFAHPLDDSHLLDRKPVKRVLVPGEWMRKMFEPYYGDKVIAWPVGIDTKFWSPSGTDKHFDFLIYDKVRWEHDRYTIEFLNPICSELSKRNLTFTRIRYGSYRKEQFLKALRQCGAMIFLCEHETQGIAYQQALSCGIPILAWDRGGYWQDPAFYPHKVRFSPVSSVPYWDQRCGVTFQSQQDFPDRLDAFLTALSAGRFSPREYILENLTLEQCARRYVGIVDQVRHETNSSTTA